jgi:hypothetical protein
MRACRAISAENHDPTRFAPSQIERASSIAPMAATPAQNRAA